MIKSTSEIRKAFLKFFYLKNHKIISSSSLIPKNDNTLLLTNSGMNQFKNIFLGLEKSKYKNIVTVQRCVRAGGKHNDLDHVGYTNKHHTFFEMLGNFSFGGYFKKDAIKFAWELLTHKNWFAIPKKKLLITVYEKDDETYNIWFKDIGINKNNLIRIGDNKGNKYYSDNFWQMGDTGPCGPCSEIFYDYEDSIPNNINKNFLKNKERYIEIWNLVFMQFNRKNNGIMDPLPNPSVDTGMGLERIASVLQFVKSNYDIDIFKKIISSLKKITNISNLNINSIRIIADHIRCSIFLIGDGIYPSNEKQGYVLKRIIRRAIFHGNKLGIKDYFLYKLVFPVIKIMKLSSFHLSNDKIFIKNIIYNEEKKFHKTLKNGLYILNKEFSKLNKKKLDGKIAFWLYDTHGFPLDLTKDICKYHNISINENVFKKEMEIQKNKSKVFNKKLIDIKNKFELKCNKHTKFLGFNKKKCITNIIGLYQNNIKLDCLSNNNESIIILNETPFYGESSGQTGDIGKIIKDNSYFKVIKTKKYKKNILHIGFLINGFFKIKDQIIAKINTKYRNSISLNHSATHLLHYSLKKIFGDSIKQKGSYIDDKHLRFDFLYNDLINDDHISSIEEIVNNNINKNLSIKSEYTTLKEAKNKGALMLPYKKYPDYVRMVSISNISIELCGGTHVNNTKKIILFLINKKSSVASGIKRIEAITGKEAIKNIIFKKKQLFLISKIIKVNENDIVENIKNLYNTNYFLKKKLKEIENKKIKYKIKSLLKKIKIINNINIICKYIENISIKIIYKIIDYIKSNLDPYIIVIFTIINNKINIFVNVSKKIIKYIKATDIIEFFIEKTKGNGGGSYYSARANSNNLHKLNNVFIDIKKIIYKKFKNNTNI
ncbi:alanine--tRNA ligase [Sodalis-like secondary symbiont of Drepanosiphum platanoidis]|uniref:alanine--tRNA ligase n=1 Tax=Sodalis-like secondary symbiont of Drepanosiphum platanoidis TaxID=2994493 RepID=UPI003463D2EE